MLERCEDSEGRESARRQRRPLQASSSLDCVDSVGPAVEQLTARLTSG